MKIFSVINLSHESPQQSALCSNPALAIKKIHELRQLGADYIDLGARSSASNTTKLKDNIEKQRLEKFFEILPVSDSAYLSLDTWSVATSLHFIPQIAILNYTSTFFPQILIQKLAETQCPLILNYLAATDPYSLRNTAYTTPKIDTILAYFTKTVTYLRCEGVRILAIDPNLGIWHPATPEENIPHLQKNMIESIPLLQDIAPVFIIIPRTANHLNRELTHLILSKQPDFIRTHDLLALKKLGLV